MRFLAMIVLAAALIAPPLLRPSEARAQGKVKHFNMFDTWVQAAPAILEFLGR